jgi:hypothetical protein
MRKADEKSARKEEERLAKEQRKSVKSEGAVVAPVAESTAATTADPSTTTATTPATEPATESTIEPSTSAVEPETPGTETEPATATLTAPFVAPTTEESSTEPATHTREPPTAPAAIRTSMEDQASPRMREAAGSANASESSPASPSKGKMRGWLKSKFAGKSGKSQKSPTAEKSEVKRDAPKRDTPGQFVGGAALTGANVKNDSTASPTQHDSSVRDVPLAAGPSATTEDTHTATTEHTHTSNTNEIPVSEYLSRDTDMPAPEKERLGGPARRASEVSSLSSVEGNGDDDETADEEFQEARDNFNEDLAPPPTFGVGTEKSSSPVRDSKFKEAI